MQFYKMSIPSQSKRIDVTQAKNMSEVEIGWDIEIKFHLYSIKDSRYDRKVVFAWKSYSPTSHSPPLR